MKNNVDYIEGYSNWITHTLEILEDETYKLDRKIEGLEKNKIQPKKLINSIFNLEKFKKFINKKNKKEYTALSNVVYNCTNAQDGQQMVLYTDGERLYVRELDEFNKKFE